MVGVFVAFIRVVYGRMIYMSLPSTMLDGSNNSGSGRNACLSDTPS